MAISFMSNPFGPRTAPPVPCRHFAHGDSFASSLKPSANAAKPNFLIAESLEWRPPPSTLYSPARPTRPLTHRNQGDHHGPSRHRRLEGNVEGRFRYDRHAERRPKGLPYSFKGRFEDESGKSGTNPEELIAAAHAGCFAMQLSHFLAENGTPAENLDAKAVVTLAPGTGITGSAITLVGTVPGITADKFTELANKAKGECPVSRALGAINVTLDAKLA